MQERPEHGHPDHRSDGFPRHRPVRPPRNAGTSRRPPRLAGLRPEMSRLARSIRRLLIRSDLSPCGLVPSTLYGPGYHTDGRQMHFIFDLIRKILQARGGGAQPVLWGDGHQRRELVYIDDFVKAAVDLAGTVENTLINIGAGEESSIR